MEIGSTPSMTLLGFSKYTMKPGDVITVQLYPAKSGSPVGRMHRITFSDGSQLFDMDKTEPPSKRVEYKE